MIADAALASVLPVLDLALIQLRPTRGARGTQARTSQQELARVCPIALRQDLNQFRVTVARATAVKRFLRY
jgi:hypothetical protein